MDNCGICYDPVLQGIVIPHYNIDGELVGIRERTLIKEEEENGKYKPAILNYQMYISGSGSNECFLINIHTGEMWRYGKNLYGDKVFLKLDMPWEDKNKNISLYQK
mgnify:CR=1 FL=1